jgi:hypothetical protein
LKLFAIAFTRQRACNPCPPALSDFHNQRLLQALVNVSGRITVGHEWRIHFANNTALMMIAGWA